MSENSNIFETLGVRTIVNAKGPATRLSGGIMRPEVAGAMARASHHCVDMAELQAAASRNIRGRKLATWLPALRPACCWHRLPACPGLIPSA